jgi:signal peptidase
MKYVQRAANVLTLVLTGLAFLLLVGVTLLPNFVNYKTYIVLSGSMAPAISTGSMVIAQAVSPESLKVGDVIVYNRSDVSESVSHRIIAVDAGPLFRTKGDANGAADEWTVQYSGGSAGKVVLSVPYVGLLYHAANTPQGRLVFLVVPILVLSLMWLAQLWKPSLRPDRLERELPAGLKPAISLLSAPPRAATTPTTLRAMAEPPPLPLRQ